MTALDFDKLQILGRRVIVRKCICDHLRREDGSVWWYKTDFAYEFTNWAEIIAVGDKCKLFTKEDIGNLIWCPERHNQMSRLGESEFILTEDIISDSRWPLMVVGE